MSSKVQHLSVIKQNYLALTHLTNPNPAKYSDWCITIIFYMALHYIHAYLATQDEHPSAHIQLQPIISKDQNLRSLYHKYRSLQDDSNEARYFGKKFEIYNIRIDTLKWFKDVQTKIFQLLKLHDEIQFDLYAHFPLKNRGGK